MTPSQRLAALGIDLPEVAAPLATYVPAVRTGSLVHTAGQLPLQHGMLIYQGKLGADITPEQGQEAARCCALNALAAIHALVGIDTITQIVKVVGFVASAPGFNGQPAVINGASEVLGEIFGSAGAHARSAVGVCELPLNAPVEIDIIVEVA